MTNILDTKSGKEFLQLSQQEIAEMKSEINSTVNQIRILNPEEAKKKLRDLRFGTLKNSLLHLASEFGNESDVALMLETAEGDHGIIDARNVDFFTAMHYAAIGGHYNIVQLLIEAEADLNPLASEKKRRWTPIHYAAKYGNVKVVESLIFSGVNKETKTGFGLTPLIIASEFGKAKLVEFLLSIAVNKDAKTIEENHCMNALHYAVVDKSIDVVKLLLMSGIDRNLETTSGFTALDFAAKADNVTMVSLLLKWGVGNMDISLKVANENHAKESAELIKKYIAARKKVFNKKWLNQHESDLARILEGFDRSNIHEEKIIIADDVILNAYGFLSLKYSFGFFSKVTKTFVGFASEKTANELPEAINKLMRIVGL